MCMQVVTIALIFAKYNASGDSHFVCERHPGCIVFRVRSDGPLENIDLVTVPA